MQLRQMFILKDGTAVIIREVSYSDAIKLNRLAAQIFSSTNEVLTSIDEFQTNNTTAAQLKRIKHYIQKEGKCILVAEIDNQLVGTIDFWNGHRAKIAHTGEFGLGVHPSFRNKGIGHLLLEKLLDWTTQNPLIEKVKLGVFASNKRAIHLYKKMGFMEEGRRIAEIKTAEDNYIDIIEMYKIVK